jgi:cytochrome c-type biogenesis protein CcmH/NrfF
MATGAVASRARLSARRTVRTLSLGWLAVMLLAVATSAVPPEQPEGWAYDLWRDVMSPFCPGRSLADCPSPEAENLRMWILDQEAGGQDRAQVEAQLFERYGDAVLAAPRARGFGLTAYAIPVATFVFGGVVVGVFLRRQTRTPADAAPVGQPLDSELARAIDEELGR